MSQKNPVRVDRLRSERLTIMLTPAEYTKFQKYASEHNLSESSAGQIAIRKLLRLKVK